MLGSARAAVEPMPHSVTHGWVPVRASMLQGISAPRNNPLGCSIRELCSNCRVECLNLELDEVFVLKQQGAKRWYSASHATLKNELLWSLAMTPGVQPLRATLRDVAQPPDISEIPGAISQGLRRAQGALDVRGNEHMSIWAQSLGIDVSALTETLAELRRSDGTPPDITGDADVAVTAQARKLMPDRTCESVMRALLQRSRLSMGELYTTTPHAEGGFLVTSLLSKYGRLKDNCPFCVVDPALDGVQPTRVSVQQQSPAHDRKLGVVVEVTASGGGGGVVHGSF